MAAPDAGVEVRFPVLSASWHLKGKLTAHKTQGR
jgi:hypothetical protein